MDGQVCKKWRRWAPPFFSYSRKKQGGLKRPPPGRRLKMVSLLIFLKYVCDGRPIQGGTSLPTHKKWTKIKRLINFFGRRTETDEIGCGVKKKTGSKSQRLKNVTRVFPLNSEQNDEPFRFHDRIFVTPSILEGNSAPSSAKKPEDKLGQWARRRRILSRGP